MSHNEQKIGTAKPSISGQIQPDLGDINDVTITSVADNELLQYNSSSSKWINSNVVVSSNYIWIGQGESDDYSNTGNTGNISNGDAWYCYDSSPRNTITGATITKVGATDWIDYITLPAGLYVIDAQFFAEWSASGYLSVSLYRSTNATPTWTTNDSEKLSHIAYIGETLSSYAVSNVLTGQFEITSGEVTAGQNRVRLQVVASSNLKDYDGGTKQGDTPAEYTYIHIKKIGT